MAESWRRACESGYCVEYRPEREDMTMGEWEQRCDTNACVQVRKADGPGRWQLRDSKLGEFSPVLSFTAEELDAFAAGWLARVGGTGER